MTQADNTRSVNPLVCWYCGERAEYVEPDRYGDRPICSDHACDAMQVGIKIIPLNNNKIKQ